uniref:Activin_recp domain-containing protein n=1 Tax=Angiostrongylus cantonensis TaxID=6313 RepID=A0A158PC07_ANGCA
MYTSSPHSLRPPKSSSKSGAQRKRTYSTLSSIRAAGTSTVTCSSPTDYCYNATADISQLNELSMAGCSTTRCFLSRNKCINQILNGREIKFCCCNSGDLCNSKYSNLTLFEKVKERIKDISKVIG